MEKEESCLGHSYLNPWLHLMQGIKIAIFLCETPKDILLKERYEKSRKRE